MSHELLVVKDAVEARLRCQVDAVVGEPRHDLLRRQVAELGAGRHLDDARTLRRRECVGGRRPRSSALVIADIRVAPTSNGARAEADRRARRLESCAFRLGLLDKLENHFSLSGSVSSAPSPQMARTFFWSTRSAAASASALSLRRNSFSSSRT